MQKVKVFFGFTALYMNIVRVFAQKVLSFAAKSATIFALLA